MYCRRNSSVLLSNYTGWRTRYMYTIKFDEDFVYESDWVFFLLSLSTYLLIFIKMLTSPHVRNSGDKRRTLLGSPRGQLSGAHHGKLLKSSTIGIMAFSNICRFNTDLNATHYYIHCKNPNELWHSRKK